jgi:6-pyruvoyltetrahydropterin/6-carboxytetrahydropterin synthase
MIRLTRRYQFSASHRLHSSALSEPENDRIYGKCNNPYGHGHNYEVEITVTGPIDPETGRVVDLADLDALVQDQVVARFDHRNLNEEIMEFERLVPTTENLGVVIDGRLRGEWHRAFPETGPALERVRIYETARNIFEI